MPHIIIHISYNSMIAIFNLYKIARLMASGEYLLPAFYLLLCSLSLNYKCWQYINDLMVIAH